MRCLFLCVQVFQLPKKGNMEDQQSAIQTNHYVEGDPSCLHKYRQAECQKDSQFVYARFYKAIIILNTEYS